MADEQGNPRYAVEGELFSWGKRLHLYDGAGNAAAFIRPKVMSFLPRYFVGIGGVTAAAVVKELSFFRPSYRVDGVPWQMTGDFWAHDYHDYVMHNGQNEIMRMCKAWFTWGDSYELQIHDGSNELLCPGVALAVDCATAQASNH